MKDLFLVYKIKSRTYGAYQGFEGTSCFIFILESGHLILNLVSATQYVTFKKSLTDSGPQFLICKQRIIMSALLVL